MTKDISKNISTGFERGTSCVYKVMTSETVSLGPDDTVAEAVYLMATRQVRHLLVFDGGGQIVGKVCYPDTLYALAYGPTTQTKEVRQIMRRTPATVNPRTPLFSALSKMLAQGVLIVLQSWRTMGNLWDVNFR